MNSEFTFLKQIELFRDKFEVAYQVNDKHDNGHTLNEEKFVLALRNSNDALWDLNLETGEIYYSPHWKSMLGFGEHELENNINAWEALLHPNEKDLVLEKILCYLAGETSVFEVEIRMRHKQGDYIYIRSRAFKLNSHLSNQPLRLIGTHVDITKEKKAEEFNTRHAKILEMIAKGKPASEIYIEIGLMYEERHPGLRCSMLELDGNKLVHGGAPSLPKEYCDAVNGLEYGPNVGSCGTATYTGKSVFVEDIETDPKWEKIKHFALPHGMRCCWSEPVKSSSGKVLGAFGMYYDHPALPNEEELSDLISAGLLTGIVMERDQMNKHIRKLAYTDQLTQLSNRAHLYLFLEELIKQSTRYGREFHVIYIDLDNFKNINDNFGHYIGDLHLQDIAKRLTLASREVDCVARLGGDEFCIVLTEISDSINVNNIAQRYLNTISMPSDVGGREFIQTCSMGIAHYPNDGLDLQTLLKAADTALYSAKAEGKNGITFYAKTQTKKAEYRFQLEQDLLGAIKNHQLSLVYQPQIDINTGQIIGVEALSRWLHPKFGPISPTDFFAAAERLGMIKQLTEWVLYTACAQAVSWKKRGCPAVRMAVNISTSQILNNDIISLVKRVIDDTGMHAKELELEFSEKVVQPCEDNVRIFKALKKLGVLLAIDDFGTVYSSSASLQDLSVDCLKIHKRFIDTMVTDKKSGFLVRSMIEMGHHFDKEIISEGVETPEQLSMLKELDCEIAQGYFFSHPVQADKISELHNIWH